MKDEIIACARGDIPADIIFADTRIVNVFSGEIVSGNIAVYRGIIVGIGDYEARDVRDMNGMVAAPGLIDAHVHLESSMTGIAEFARAVLPRGTTTVVADPHEIANVLGLDGIQFMLDSSADLALNVFFMMSSCVPATDMETAGASLGPEEIRRMLKHDRVLGLAEMMNYPGVIFRDPMVLSKIESCRKARKPIDGHAPGLTGRDLNAYLTAGISSDHECTTVEEAREKLRGGMHIMIREGSGAKNLHTLLPLISPGTECRLMWCTDDRNPADLVHEGHIDSMVRAAVQSGISPITAIRMATLYPASYFGLHHLGAIAPGRQADLVFFPDLRELFPARVVVKGETVAENGNMRDIQGILRDVPIPQSMKVRPGSLDFQVPAAGDSIRVIEILPDQIVTRAKVCQATIDQGKAVADIRRDILKLAVVERHRNTGNVGKGFVMGLGLRRGALATSVAHDSHNIIVVGANADAMRTAVEPVIEMGGGIAVVSDGCCRERLALPIAGLMSTEPVGWVESQLRRMISAAQDLGCRLKDPFTTLSFLSLPVIPELKLTDRGLVDGTAFRLVPLFV